MSGVLIVIVGIVVLLVAPTAQADVVAVRQSFGYEVVGVTNQLVAAGATGSAAVNCPAGKKPLGGGVYAGSNDMRLNESFPLGAPSSPSGWLGTVFNGDSNASVFDVYAICARV
jgi:hypothetical protein